MNDARQLVSKAPFTIEAEDLELLSRVPLPLDARAWLTRGYIRACLLGDLQPQDDLDIVVASPVERLEAALAGLVDRRTVHGGFSLRKIGKRRIDVWSLFNTYGVPCQSVGHALSLFEFSCDAFAIELPGDKLVSDGRALALLRNKTFDIQKHYPFLSERVDFLLTKGIYLCLRHGLSPGPVLSALFRESTTTTQPDMAAIARRLGDELMTLGRTANSEAFLRQFPGVERRLSMMLGI